ncbi:MAG: M23 family metallopeptidase [Bacteroidetes bacterium]|nr:M23 family metallopeptidase [Bacteroidota bacterium]
MNFHFCRKGSFLLLNIFFFVSTEAQQGLPIISKNYFRDPLSVPIQLSANFGELRPNHFHMGFDIRTQSRENLPVFAAAEGYISRVKVEKYGFGNAIYITHPNGFTTLYAHLNSFSKPLQEYVLQKQYEQQTWAIDLEIPSGIFPVQKGEFIAHSGNTGASAGPHLHFEIRNTATGKNYNPGLFGFEIPDTKKPVINALYLYDRRLSTYFQKATAIPITGENGNYFAKEKWIKVHSPLISFAINATDKNNNSPFNHGIYAAEISMDGNRIFGFQLDSISYDETRYVNACIDYSVYERQKKYIQYLFSLPGNDLKIFMPSATQGLVILSDTNMHNIQIKVNDLEGNTSILSFKIQLTSIDNNFTYPADAIPFMPGQENNVQGNSFEAHFSSKAFYESFPFSFKEIANKTPNNASEIVSLGDETIPVHDAYDMRIRTTLSPNDPLKKSTVMQLAVGNKKDYQKGIWSGDWMQGSFRSLGKISLIIDTIPPEIFITGWKNGQTFSANSKLSFRATDKGSAIESFVGKLDGDWILFSNRNGLYTYNFDSHCTVGKHILNITVRDIAGNETIKEYTFSKQ